MTALEDELLELAMLRATTSPADATSLRDALWRKLHDDGWRPTSHGDRAFGTTTSDSDRVLLERFLQGDASAFDQLVGRHASELLGYARSSLRQADAEDAVQEAYLALFRKAHACLADPKCNLRGFLFVAARYEVGTILRKQLKAECAAEALARQLPPHDPNALEQLLTRERPQLARALNATCTPLEQDVILMTLENKTHAEVARALELELGHVRVLKHRALQKLKREFSKEGES